MSLYEVKFESYNRENYSEMVSGKNEKDARKAANKLTIKHDDRDKILSITERNDLNVYYTGQ